MGYSCGTTYLVGVEDKEILDSIKPGKVTDQNILVNYGSVTCLSWQSRSDEKNPTTSFNNYVCFIFIFKINILLCISCDVKF